MAHPTAFIGLRCLLLALTLAAVVRSSPPQIPLRVPPVQHSEDSNGAVTSESKICSEIGIKLLKQGGNAADALVGTTLCVGTIGMYHSGLGGGGFMLIRGPDGSYESVDFREAAPQAAHRDMYKHDVPGSVHGGQASGVPSELRGLEYLHRKYGKLPWEKVVKPAVKVARYGFPVGAELNMFMDYFSLNPKYNFLVDDPNWAIDFAPNGTRLGKGDIITRKRYADTLELIATKGPDVFYEGALAAAMIKEVQRQNGTMTMEDLRAYKVLSYKPVNITFRGYKLWASPAPASGAIALSILKILEQYPIEDAKDANLSTHRLIEAMKYAYGQRTLLGDPAFVQGIRPYEEDIISQKVAQEIKKKISDKHTHKNITDYDPWKYEVLNDHGTSHVVAVDSSGLAITLTTTVNLIFGSQVMVPETGVIMNNEMDDFSIPERRNAFGFVPSPSNYIRPFARPVSSITPVIVEFANNNSLYFVTGAAGGSRIISATVQSLWHVLQYNRTAPEALKAPRLHHQLSPDLAAFELTFDNATIASMVEKGHNVTWARMGLGSMQCIRRLPNGTFEAASEPRQKDSGSFAW